MFDRDLVGALLEQQIGRHFSSWPDAERQSGVSRSTLWRVANGDPSVKPATYRRIESALDLQSGAIDKIAHHDWTSAVEIGAPPEMIDWARRYADERADQGQ